MNELEEKIIDKISKKGPLTFEQFMEMALYEPGLGYYSTKEKRIGKEGDFYTSSHLHPVFGALIGKQIEEIWEQMGMPRDFTIAEMGAGEGYVCRDILSYLGSAQRKSNDKKFYENLRYVIIEKNPFQRQCQMALLKDVSPKINWLSDIKEMDAIKGCIFSNELLDAFPVHRIKMEDELREIYVDYDGKSFIEKTSKCSTPEIDKIMHQFLMNMKSGYTTEVNLRMKKWLGDIESVLNEGCILTIDYGYSAQEYYDEDRDRGTLMCYYRHQMNENPYLNIGEQDITSHLNFSALKKWGEEIGIETIGFTSQGSFLISLGIDQHIKELSETSREYVFELSRIKKLMLPQGLGDSHQVIIQYKGAASMNLSGFRLRNRLRHL